MFSMYVFSLSDLFVENIVPLRPALPAPLCLCPAPSVWSTSSLFSLTLCSSVLHVMEAGFIETVFR